jgi:hypothetical protein
MAIGSWMQAFNCAKGLPSKLFLALYELNRVGDGFKGKSSPQNNNEEKEGNDCLFDVRKMSRWPGIPKMKTAVWSGW